MASNASSKPVFLTKEGLTKLQEELQFLTTVRRREVAERIHQAKEQGDITDNAEYEDAKNEQAFLEGRIMLLEQQLRNAVLIENSSGNSEVVRLGSTVTIQDRHGVNETYCIVGSTEARPKEGKISNESPMGRALLGRRVGEEVAVHAPSGTLFFTVLTIQ